MRREKKASEENPCPFSVLVVSDVGKLAEIRAKNIICVEQLVVPLRRRSRSCATYFARGGDACEEFHRGLVLMLVDPHTQGQRTVQDCSSRNELWYVSPIRHFAPCGGHASD